MFLLETAAEQQSTLDKPCLLGRVDPARVLDRSAWTYYAGGGNWSASVGAAVSVFSGLDILNVSWNSYLQRFVAIYAAVLSQQRHGPHGNGQTMYVSYSRGTGTFTSEIRLVAVEFRRLASTLLVVATPSPAPPSTCALGRIRRSASDCSPEH